MSENIIDVDIGLINAEGRFRKDFGDIQALAKSISDLGLLQPIGIDSGYRLVFGERRLRAFKHLGRKEIPARFVNLDSLLSGEYAENEFRKDFTVSERVEIGKALEGELQGRVGRPGNGGKNSTIADSPEGKTRDLAAKAAGFGNGKTYEQAKTVVEKAAPELVAAMDEGRVSVSAAAALSDLPKAEQAIVVRQDAKSVQAAAKKAKEKKAKEAGARRPAAPAIQPVATPVVLHVINCMDVLLRHAQAEGVSVAALAQRFLDEVEPEHPVIADRLKATLPAMAAIGQIHAAMTAQAEVKRDQED
jgi:ParB family chromosome partitioning protein